MDFMVFPRREKYSRNFRLGIVGNRKLPNHSVDHFGQSVEMVGE